MSQASSVSPTRCNRRAWMQAAAAGLAAAASPSSWCCGGQSPPTRPGCTLSIGTYSLKGLSIDESIDLVARTGYDGMEISVQPGFDGEPAKLSAARRKRVRQRLESKRLKLTSLMEQLTPAVEDRQHQEHLRRLQQVVELARQLARPSLP